MAHGRGEAPRLSTFVWRDGELANAFSQQCQSAGEVVRANLLAAAVTVHVECAQGDVVDSTQACSALVATMSLFSHLTNRSNGCGKLLRRIGSAPIS